MTIHLLSLRFLIFHAVICAFLLVSVPARCQPPGFTKTPTLGINMSFVDFEGANKLSSFGHSMKPGLALHFQNNLSRRFDYSIMLAGSFLEFPDNKIGNIAPGKKQLLLENDFTLRARLLKSVALFNPYAVTGAGWSQYDNQYGIYIPVGVGVQVNMTPDLFLLVNSQYRVGVTANHPNHFFNSIGIAGAITRKKIARTAPAELAVPVVRQVATADTDGDGIADNLDSCPYMAGVVRYYGCPVPDSGKVNMRSGSPSLEALRTIVDRVARQIFFETGSYRLLSSSFSSLDTVAHVLKENQALQLSIEGHTDNVGQPADNQTLSQNRANTVMDYLIKSGVEAGRLQATGYGQQQPVATNATPEGRATNRRVVLYIHY